MEARHASQLAALQEKLAAAQMQQESAVSRLQKEQEAERERVKRAIAELKKKLDRHGHHGARSHERGLTQSMVSTLCLTHVELSNSLIIFFPAAVLQALVHYEEACQPFPIRHALQCCHIRSRFPSCIAQR